MFGTKKLSTIRKELEQALGEDPTSELDRHISAAKRDGEGTEIMEGLKLFLQRAQKSLRRKRPTGAKK